MTAGLRFDHNTDQLYEIFSQNTNQSLSHTPETDLTGIGNTKNNYKNVTYKARVEGDVSPTNMLYAQVSSGFLPGSSQLFVDSNTSQITSGNFAQSKLTAYEIGSKNRFFDNKLTLNADIFYYDYAGFQQSINTSLTSTPVFAIFTVPARFKGAEVEGGFAATPNDHFTATFAYLRGKFHDIPVAATQYFALDRVPNTAPIRITGGYDHTFNLGHVARLTAHIDGRYFTSYQVIEFQTTQTQYKNLTQQPSKFIGDTSLTLSSAKGGLSLTGYIRNFTNKVYKTSAAIQSAVTLTLSEPRIYGLTGTVRF